MSPSRGGGQRPGSTAGPAAEELQTVASFLAKGRSVTLQRSTRTRLARVLVDGAPVAMTFSRTEYSTTNAGSYDRVLEPPHEAAWVDLGPFGKPPLELEVREIATGVRAIFRTGGRLAEIYNTVVYESAWLTLELPHSLDRATLALDVHSDTSS